MVSVVYLSVCSLQINTIFISLSLSFFLITVKATPKSIGFAGNMKPFATTSSQQPFMGFGLTGMTRSADHQPLAAAASVSGQQRFMGIGLTGMARAYDKLPFSSVFPDFGTLYKSTMNPFKNGQQAAFGNADFGGEKYVKRRSVKTEDQKDIKPENQKNFEDKN